MALFRPDEYRHNNSNYAISDIREVRGGSYSVDTINDRDGIPPNKRGRAIIYVIDISKLFTYIGPLNPEGDSRAEDVNWLNPNYWREITTGGSGGGDFHIQSELKDLEVQYTSIETDNEPIVGEEISYSGATWVNTYNSDGARAIGIQINLGFSGESIADFSESHILSPSVNFKYDFPGIGATFEINGIDTDGGAVLGEAPYNIRWNHELLFGYLSDITDANLISDIQSGVNVESTIKGYDTDNINSKAVLLGTTNTDDIINHTYIAYPKDFGKISNLFLNSGESIFNAFEEYSTTITITNKHGIDVEYYLYYSIDKGAIGSDQFITLIGSSNTGIGNSGGNVTFEDTNVEYNPALDELTIGFVDGTSGSTNILGAIFEGTYDELKTLKDNNQLVVGRRYILKNFQTKYIIDGSYSGTDDYLFEYDSNVGSYLKLRYIGDNKDFKRDVIKSGDNLLCFIEITEGNGTHNIGDIITITSIFNNDYIIPSVSASSMSGTKFKIKYKEFTLDETFTNNGQVILDSNGKEVLTPNGVINTSVHDGLPYGNYTTEVVPLEDISLVAINSSTFSQNAESLTYVGDFLTYNFNDNEIKNRNGDVLGSREGVITRRNNPNLNINIDDDWRHKKYRRYKISDENQLRLFYKHFENPKPTNGSLGLYYVNSNIATINTNFNDMIKVSGDTGYQEFFSEFSYILNKPEKKLFITDFTQNNTVDNPFRRGIFNTTAFHDGGGLQRVNMLTTDSDRYQQDIYASDLNNFIEYPIIPYTTNDGLSGQVNKVYIKNSDNIVFKDLKWKYHVSYNDSQKINVYVDSNVFKDCTFETGGDVNLVSTDTIDLIKLGSCDVNVVNSKISNTFMNNNFSVAKFMISNSDLNRVFMTHGSSGFSYGGIYKITASNIYSTIITSDRGDMKIVNSNFNVCNILNTQTYNQQVANYLNTNIYGVNFNIDESSLGLTISLDNFRNVNYEKTSVDSYTYSEPLVSGTTGDHGDNNFYYNTDTSSIEFRTDYSIKGGDNITLKQNTNDLIKDTDFTVDNDSEGLISFNITLTDGDVLELTDTYSNPGIDLHYNNKIPRDPNDIAEGQRHGEIRLTPKGTLYSPEVNEDLQLIYRKII